MVSSGADLLCQSLTPRLSRDPDDMSRHSDTGMMRQILGSVTDTLIVQLTRWRVRPGTSPAEPEAGADR
jgi:hypothetical protein